MAWVSAWCTAPSLSDASLDGTLKPNIAEKDIADSEYERQILEHMRPKQSGARVAKHVAKPAKPNSLPLGAWVFEFLSKRHQRLLNSQTHPSYWEVRRGICAL